MFSDLSWGSEIRREDGTLAIWISYVNDPGFGDDVKLQRRRKKRGGGRGGVIELPFTLIKPPVSARRTVGIIVP